MPSGLSANLQSVREWIKRRRFYVIAAAMCSFAASYGEIRGGFRDVYEDGSWVIGRVAGEHRKEPAMPNYNVQLVGVSGKPEILDASVAPAGVRKAMVVQLTMRNLADPTVGILGDSKAILDGRSQIEWPHENRSLPMGRGITVTTEGAIIPIASERREMSGRIDLSWRYGPDKQHFDRTVPISGEITWETVNGKWALTFIPDGNSPNPIGMSEGVRMPPSAPPG